MWYYIDITSYLICPFYILLFYFFAKRFARKHYSHDPFFSKKFIQGFWVKIAAAIAYALFIQYYYGGGDSFRYFGYSNVMRDAISKDPSNLRFLFSSGEEFYNYCQSLSEINEFNPANNILTSDANLMTVRLSCFLSFFSFKKFLIVSLFFSMLSYIGIWKMYMLFSAIYSEYKKQIAFSFLFLPSFCFWGSGILKETVSLMALGILITQCHKFFFQRKFSIRVLVLIFATCYLIYIVKSYILASFILAFACWLIAVRFKKIKSTFVRLTVILFLVAIAAISSTFITFDAQAQEEEVLKNVEFFSNTYRASAEEGSAAAYTNVQIDPSVSGIIKGIPEVIMTIFFRPYIWEAKSMILFISMIESCFFLILTLMVLFKGKIFGFLGFIFKNPVMIFCLVISLVLGLIVGFTTFNFGTIIRYKIPCMPFFCMMLLIANRYYNNKKKEKADTKANAVIINPASAV